MIYSMTGFGRKEVTIDNITIAIELKTLNTKFFDVSFKLPNELKSKEIELRQLLANKLIRGKADFGIYIGNAGKSSTAQLNTRILGLYIDQLKAFSQQKSINIDEAEIIPHLIRLPEVFSADNDFWTEHWDTLMESVHEVVESTLKFRLDEGKSVADDLEQRVQNIMALQKEITPFEEGRIVKLRSRLNDQFNQLDSKDKDRFEQEMIYYLERLDISEEQIRLTTHCNYFLELMHDNNTDNGKRLNFVGQEMGREINTLGSKANDADIQRIVILMKDELEKIKEQVLNIV